MKYVAIENIRPGDTLAVTIFSECSILLTANSVLTERNIDRITALGFSGLYIYDGANDTVCKDLLTDNIRQKALRDLKHINIDECLYIASIITNRVLANENMLYEIADICDYDTKTYIHCINVAVLATMIGIDMRLNNDELYELAQAALLHDIGKVCIDEKILNKKGKLTDDEFAAMKLHPVYGCNILRSNGTISERVCKGVLHHHENEDGSGYPKRLKSDEIPLFAKIIHVADVYDAMISKRSYKERINPADVLEYIMGNTAKFDFKAVEALTHCVSLYPVGSEVLLSDGTKATVRNNIKEYPQRPDVKLEDGTVLRLIDKLDMTITSLLT